MIYEVAFFFLFVQIEVFLVYELVMVCVIIVLCVWMFECAGVGLCSSSLRGYSVLQREREQSTGTGAVWWTNLQWGREFNQPVDRWDVWYIFNYLLIPDFKQFLTKRIILQVLCRRASATMCSAVWRRSSLSVALAIGIAVTMVSRFVGQMGSSTRTSVRWRCLPVEMGHASSKFHCPSAQTVRTLSHISCDT